jgi:uncharacterized protein YndB with AHSA1/START domain
MKTKGLIANTQTSVNAPTDKVWDAFTNPEIIKKYMFGTTVSSEWKNGSEITWKGECPENGSTTVLLSQDNNKTEDARQHSENNWTMMLSELKKLLEGK